MLGIGIAGLGHGRTLLQANGLAEDRKELGPLACWESLRTSRPVKVRNEF